MAAKEASVRQDRMPCGRKGRGGFRSAAVAAAIAVMWPTACFAWGSEGHKVIAIIAQSRLDTKATAATRDLLAREGKKDLADIANWADKVKRYDPSRPLHSVRIPLNDGAPDWNTLCPISRRPCATRAAAEYISTLCNLSSSAEDKTRALKYVVHLIGDIHQPLHASSRTGREKVLLGYRRTTLHKVWDTLILRYTGRTVEGLAEELASRPGAEELETGGTPQEWALESRDIARDIIFAELSSFPKVGELVNLPRGYTVSKRKIVFDRLTQAGFRLARELNSCLGEGSGT